MVIANCYCLVNVEGFTRLLTFWDVGIALLTPFGNLGNTSYGTGVDSETTAVE